MINLRNLINLGFIHINLYGIVFLFAFIAVFWIIRKYLKSDGKNPELAYTAVIYLIIGTLTGARIFYEAFYNFYNFLGNPVEIFYLWQGGLSFHGGVLGVAISSYFFCRKYKIDYLKIADTISIPVIFFLALGKIANFFNSELYGKITNVPWCVNFSEIEGCRHPVQIYESVKNFSIFFFLIYLKRKNVKKGIIFFSLIFLYSFLRFFIDFYRVYDTNFFGLGIGQYLNIITFLISGYFLIKSTRK